MIDSELQKRFEEILGGLPVYHETYAKLVNAVHLHDALKQVEASSTRSVVAVAEPAKKSNHHPIHCTCSECHDLGRFVGERSE